MNFFSNLKYFFYLIYHKIRWLLKRSLDFFNFFLIFLISLKKKEVRKKDIKKILLIQLQGIGDLIMTADLIESLKIEYGVKIDLICIKKNADFFKHDSRINIIEYKGFFDTLKSIRKKRYDLVISPFRAEHSGLLTILSNSKYKLGYLYSLNLSSNNLILDLNFQKTRNQRDMVSNIIKALKIKKYCYKIKVSKEEEKYVLIFLKANQIILNCQNNWLSRSLLKENWIKLIKELDKKKYNIILIGEKKYFEYNQDIIKESKVKNIHNLSGKLNVLETISLFKKSKIFITTDCGPLHMAYIAKIPTVISLFGSTNPYYLVPNNYFKQVIWKNQNGNCPQFNFNNEPKKEISTCMLAISVEEVIEKL